MKFPNDFLLGTATAAHQVEGSNIHSDSWVQEHCKYSPYSTPSLEAVDHYRRYEEDIRLMAEAGLNAYRFSIEWARIEPEEGKFDGNEIAHYAAVLDCCRASGIEPVVTLHHFTSPKWLITKGGWEAESTIDFFARYCGYVAEKLSDKLHYVCTINEANMGLQMAAMIKRMMKQAGGNLQIGMDPTKNGGMAAAMREMALAFGLEPSQQPQTFLSPRTPEGDQIIINAHKAARAVLKKKCPHVKVGLTLSLHDIQSQPGGEEQARRIWEDEFLHYLPCLRDDDFLGVQNYTREIIGADGIQNVPEGNPLTQMNYEDYPEALEHVIRAVAKELPIPLLVTENGIATTDDARRIQFIDTALNGAAACIADGISLKGYLHWSFMDNYEWAKAYSVQFGLVAVDRATQERIPKPSLKHLGSWR